MYLVVVSNISVVIGKFTVIPILSVKLYFIHLSLTRVSALNNYLLIYKVLRKYYTALKSFCYYFC